MNGDNLKIWEAHADIDPKFTKPITGKAYKGTSPNPQYVVRCLTELFGPVGIGFGWNVIAEDFTKLGDETLHWCRISFWHTDRANTFESYGQTKAAYPTSSGKFMVDEDAPKKSLTDAIIKAASHIGIGANIFLGRWDDQKYVAEVNAEYRAEEKKASTPAYDPTADIDLICGARSGTELFEIVKALGDKDALPPIAAAIIDRLRVLVKGAPSLPALDAFAKAFAKEWPHVKADADARRNELMQEKDAA